MYTSWNNAVWGKEHLEPKSGQAGPGSYRDQPFPAGQGSRGWSG